MKHLVVNYCRKKALLQMFYWILNTSSCRSFFNLISYICVSLLEYFSIKSISASYETIVHGILLCMGLRTSPNYCVNIFVYLNNVSGRTKVQAAKLIRGQGPENNAWGRGLHKSNGLNIKSFNMMMLICIKQHLSNI